MKTDKPLTPKQEAFCLAYMLEADASAAYRKVYNAGKMKPESVNRLAYALLQNVKIASRVNVLRTAAAEAAIVTEAQVIREVARLALSDPLQLMDEHGDLKQLKDMAPEIRACIASVEIEEKTKRDPDNPENWQTYRVKKVKLWDKNSAADKLMKHLGSFEADNKQRAGVFDNLPRATVQAIHDHLRSLARPAVAGKPAAGSASRFTH